MTLNELLEKVEAAQAGSPELDHEFVRVFPSAPKNVTRSIDAVARLIEIELPGWWWTCGYCTLSNDASLYVPGSSGFPYGAYASSYTGSLMGPDFRVGPEANRLLRHPKWGKVFDGGFHRDRRGGSVPLAMLAVFLEAMITMATVDAADNALEPEDLPSDAKGESLAPDEETRLSLIDSVLTIMGAIGNDGEKVKLLAEEIRDLPNLLEELEERRDRRRSARGPDRSSP